VASVDFLQNNEINLTLNNGDVTLTLEVMKDAVFPITIDPDVNFDADENYGMNSYDAVYLTARNDTRADQGGLYSFLGQELYAGPQYWLRRQLVRWDTSSLPDGCDITNVVVSIEGWADYSDTDFNVTIVDGSAAGSTFSQYDWNDFGSVSGGSMSTSVWNSSDYNNITLDATGRGWVSKTGDTILGYLSSRDMSQTPPTGEEYITAKTSGSKLVITYTAAATPTISTNNATQVAMTTARLNSYLTVDGGELCDVRFMYNASGGAPYTNTTPWVNDTYTTGDSPYADIANLTGGTTYYFIVQGNNSQGLTNGSELSFATGASLNPPTALKAYPSSHSIDLTWIKGVGSTSTIIRAQIGDYPVNYTDGDSVYSGIQSTATYDDLTPGTCYYFKAWGKSGSDYSAANISLMATTYAGADEGASPAAPTTPDNWWGSPDYTKLSTLAGYSLVNALADDYSIPRNTMWLIIILGLIMGIGLFIYSVSNSTIGALITVGIFIVMASIAQLLPLWFIAAYCIPLAGMMMIQRRT